MLNIFTALLKSTYSPADIAKTRFQGIGKAILYVFLLSVLFTLPSAYYLCSGTVNSMNGFKTVLKKISLISSISNGELQTKASASKETEANGFVIVFDPTDAYGAKQIAAKQNAIGILKNKMVLAVDGQATEMNYSLMPADITKKKSYQH